MTNTKPAGVLLTTNDISSLRDECVALERELAELEARKADIEAKRAGAMGRLQKIDELLNALGITASSQPQIAGEDGGPNEEDGGADETEVGDGDEEGETYVSSIARRQRVGWAEAILSAISEGPYKSLTFPEIRTAIMNGPLAERLKESEKGYYNALSRLQKRRAAVREGGRLFLPDGLRFFKVALEDGRIDESFVDTHRPSPMADAIIDFVTQTGPYATASSIVEHLKSDPRFAGPVGRNATAAYNVLSRLVQREQLIKGDGGYSIPNNIEAPANAEAPKHPSLAEDQTGAVETPEKGMSIID